MRILTTSHSHPRVQNGGSEVASHALFERLRDGGEVEAWYLGCTRGTALQRAGQSITQPFADRDYLYTVGEFEDFKFANRDNGFTRDFRALLQTLRPDIVHFHHYVNSGVEAFACVREQLPDAKIVLTLHELLAICHQQGQMVTRPEGNLCRRSGPVECSRCFPEIQPADFFLRRLYVRRFLDQVDQFVAPSRFLAQRYVEWGLDERKISVIENVSRASIDKRLQQQPVDQAVLRVGFFGQISMLKGIQVLINAAAALEQAGRTDIVFRIHGDHAGQPASFRSEFHAQVERFGSNIAFEGAYDNSEVDALMAAIDVVLVPSVWWENSPVVIQEAFRNGRPVVCSNIGGMAEKVIPGETGLHFQVGNPHALANVLKALAAEPELRQALLLGVSERRQEDAFDAHMHLYRRLQTAPAIREPEPDAVPRADADFDDGGFAVP